ncbi:hypothetical protein QC764_600767 [Podospora pseudoanserina]|uniref:Uncharacterized protein n=1 Tax=Podospora pseudoanserina TaxID=2609844 RepID=A0ABR0HUD5_9PEZI|nr:hypothetical protein QC764_600767 [Podospora pseudoanserina]
MAPHAASVVVHEEIRMVWSTRLIGAPLNYGKSFLRTAIVDTTNPIVRSACVPARNLSDTTTYSDAFGSEKFNMTFPILKEDDFWVPWVPGGEEGFESGPDGTVPSMHPSLTSPKSSMDATFGHLVRIESTQGGDSYQEVRLRLGKGRGTERTLQAGAIYGRPGLTEVVAIGQGRL